MKRVKSFSIDDRTIGIIKDLASAIGISDSVAVELLVSMGINSLNANPNDVLRLIYGGVKDGETETEI